MTDIMLGRTAVDAYLLSRQAMHNTERIEKKCGAERCQKDRDACNNDIRSILDSMLGKIGFESLTAFYEANEKACWVELQRCYRPVGVCDFCKGRKRGCLSTCFPERSDVGTKPITYRWRDFYDWQYYEGNSPPGCSMHFEKIDEPSFDILWGMPSGLKPDVVERFNNVN